MNLTSEEILKKMILDSQEMVKGYEKHSKDVENKELADIFKKFAEESGYQAAEMLKMLETKY